MGVIKIHPKSLTPACHPERSEGSKDSSVASLPQNDKMTPLKATLGQTRSLAKTLPDTTVSVPIYYSQQWGYCQVKSDSGQINCFFAL
jgi:hypothetical protein